MLVWLASYPRSGNTLLRQVLKACFDLSSCEGLEQVPAQFQKPDGIRDEFYGSYFIEGDPEAFYDRARSGSELVLIKSHQLPRDNEKAIYIVRDGRLALKSFFQFQNTYHPGTTSLESLLVGDHPYGEWTSHYHAWCDRARTLVLRFEDLVVADPRFLSRIGDFLGLPGPLRPWVNPQAHLRERDPAFFGTGAGAWLPDPFWSETRLRQFYTLHGKLLAALGYAGEEVVRLGAYPEGSEEERLVRFTHALAARCRGLQQVCDERGAVLMRMKGAADEQINLLTDVCDARQQLLTELARVCETQARSANQQLNAADARMKELERQCQDLQRRLWWRRLPMVHLLRRMLHR